MRKRQEVGRGLRLCVNQDGERQDVNVLGNDVQNVNVLTVIASESYESFARGLQTELAEAVANRPRAVTPELFANRVMTDANGNSEVITQNTALEIWMNLRMDGYIDRDNALTDKFYTDRANGNVHVIEEVADYGDSIIQILDSVYNAAAMQPENARSNNVELHLDEEKKNSAEFQALWKRINKKSFYVVNFDTDELVRKSIQALDMNLRVPRLFFRVVTGTMDSIASKESLAAGEAFTKTESSMYDEHTKIAASSNVKYDLVGKLVEDTGLTRKAIVEILAGIEKDVFDQFRNNPEEFILKAAELINDQKATAIIQHITYDVLDDEYKTDIFTDATIKGKLGVNAIKTDKHLYDHVVYDSAVEKTFAENLDTSSDVAVYVKLPSGFYISTPVGKYTPDWAIAFYENSVKHIYFVAETKGDLASLELTHTSSLEKAKIDCARQHFRAISNGDVVYDVVNSYDQLLQKVMR